MGEEGEEEGGGGWGGEGGGGVGGGGRGGEGGGGVEGVRGAEEKGIYYSLLFCYIVGATGGRHYPIVWSSRCNIPGQY